MAVGEKAMRSIPLFHHPVLGIEEACVTLIRGAGPALFPNAEVETADIDTECGHGIDTQGAWSHRRSPATFQAQAVGHSGDFARVHVEVINPRLRVRTAHGPVDLLVQLCDVASIR